MPATSSTRWFFSDWLSDPNLRLCSYAARGLWMDLLCIAAGNKGPEYGMVMVNGRRLTMQDIARLTTGTDADVEILLQELEHNGVFSRTKGAVIYSRRMVRSQKNRENGKLGGNPNLLKNNETQDPVNHPPNPLNLNLSQVKKERKEVPDAGASKSQQKGATEEVVPVNEEPRARLFREGKIILIALGVTPKQSGAVIGRWLKTSPDCDGVLAALTYAYQNNVMEPIGYVTKLLNTGGKTNGRGRNVEGFDDRIKRLADEARGLERAAGIEGTPDIKRSH